MIRRAAVLAAGLGLAGLGIYSARRDLIGRVLDLRPAEHQVTIQRNIPVSMPDGATLYADRFTPHGSGPFPTILIRTPYGRSSELGPVGFLNTLGAELFAERGYNVIVQSVRGRFMSQGRFEPFVQEAADGRATLDWIAQQPWFDGSLGMWGPSYVGYCQWAVAYNAPPFLKAIVPLITSSRFSRLFYPEGAFALESSLRWTYLINTTTGHRGRLDLKSLWQNLAVNREPRLRPALAHLPIAEADARALGVAAPFYQRWMRDTDVEDSYWQSVDHHRNLGKVNVPVHLIAGWYDIFLNGQLTDYAALLAAGRMPYLTILPRHHLDPLTIWEGVRESLDWFDVHLKGRLDRLRKRPVRLALMGSHEYHEMDYWPPPAAITRYYLHGQGVLSPREPADMSVALQMRRSAYRYDPHDPTPGVGGPVLSVDGGPRDQRPVEARPDVICFTSRPLDSAVDVIGPMRLVLYVRSSLEYTDFVGRLCDVFPDGRSINICDGMLRLSPDKGELQPDGSRRIEIDMWATAQRFLPRHRIRLQVCSAAHPRWSRNLGDGGPIGAGHRGMPADQLVFHDAAHPSALLLPIVNEDLKRGN